MPFRETTSLPEIAASMKQLMSSYDAASPAFRSYQKACLERMCRWLEKFMTPSISVAAAKEALARGVEVETLRATTWEKQIGVLGADSRKVFHWEHMRPTVQMAEEILDSRRLSVGHIEAILRTAEVAWITKVEDARLNKKGYKSRRENPRACYAECGIELIDDAASNHDSDLSQV
jgi:hypothetical protein